MSSDRRLVIGLGSGRCGTQSLAALLAKQPGTAATHECTPVIPWAFSVTDITTKVLQHEWPVYNESTSVSADVAFYYLPYVRHLAMIYPSARFVCLKRHLEPTVVSFMKKTAGKNPWMNHDGSTWKQNPAWDDCFLNTMHRRNVTPVARYVEDYYEHAAELEEEMPDRFRIFEMEATFQEPSRTKQLLEFAGFESSSIVSDVPHRNSLTYFSRQEIR